jgi:hypothetical protein
MEYYSATFFAEQPIYAHVRHAEGGNWPVTVTINGNVGSYFQNPGVTFHLSDVTQLIAFKNSIIGAVDGIIEDMI